MKLTIIDFNKQFLGLDSNTIETVRPEETVLGRLLGNILAQETKGDALKLSNWAKEVYNSQLLELDKSDSDKLKNIINENNKMTIVLKAQLFECIEEAIEKSK
jgi:hypothetical protein